MGGLCRVITVAVELIREVQITKSLKSMISPCDIALLTVTLWHDLLSYRLPTFCCFLQPVLMSTGHTPMYTSAVSTLVRSHGTTAPSPPEACRRRQPPSSPPSDTLYLCLCDICVPMIISISISLTDVNHLYLLKIFIFHQMLERPLAPSNILARGFEGRM